MIKLERRIAQPTQREARRRLGEFFASKCVRIQREEISAGWANGASPADVLAAGKNHAANLPPVLEQRLAFLADGENVSVAKIARSVLKQRP